MLPRDRDEEFQRSKAVSVCLENPDPFDCELSQQQMLNQFKKDKSDNLKHKKASIRLKLTDEELYSLDLASEKGASCWLNALPSNVIISISPSQNSVTASLSVMDGSLDTCQ